MQVLVGNAFLLQLSINRNWESSLLKNCWHFATLHMLRASWPDPTRDFSEQQQPPRLEGRPSPDLWQLHYSGPDSPTLGFPVSCNGGPASSAAPWSTDIERQQIKWALSFKSTCTRYILFHTAMSWANIVERWHLRSLNLYVCMRATKTHLR